jgi:hypothetical protein
VKQSVAPTLMDLLSFVSDKQQTYFIPEIAL